jgi:hypothetical protein
MEHSQISRMALEYKPKGKCDIGRPKTYGEIKASSRLSFHRRGPRCPTSIYIHDVDDDDDDDDDDVLFYLWFL